MCACVIVSVCVPNHHHLEGGSVCGCAHVSVSGHVRVCVCVRMSVCVCVQVLLLVAVRVNSVIYY